MSRYDRRMTGRSRDDHVALDARRRTRKMTTRTRTVHGGRDDELRDIGRRLDDLPVGPVHRRAVIAIGLGLFFEVYEIFLSGSIATALKTQYGLGGTALQML